MVPQTPRLNDKLIYSLVDPQKLNSIFAKIEYDLSVKVKKKGGSAVIEFNDDVIQGDHHKNPYVTLIREWAKREGLDVSFWEKGENKKKNYNRFYFSLQF